MKKLLIAVLLLSTTTLYPSKATNTPEPKIQTKRGVFLAAIKKPKVQKFFNSHYSAAEKLKLQSGIPMQISLAQFALESGFGKSEPCKNSLNFAGIKRGGEYACYESKQAFYKDYEAVLSQCCYQNFDRSNVGEWLVALERCGYAKSKQYVRKLKIIIKSYKLETL